MMKNERQVKFNPILDKLLLVTSLLFCLAVTNLPLLALLLVVFISQTYSGGLLLLYLVCLPITPALVALYGVEMEWLAKKSLTTDVISNYFKHYRNGLKASFIWGSCFLLPVFILLFDFLVIASPLRYCFLFLLLIALAFYFYGTFFLANYYITFTNLVKLARVATFNFFISSIILSVLTCAVLTVGVISNLFVFSCLVIVLSFLQLYLFRYVTKRLPIYT